jgi:hypothetical protein
MPINTNVLNASGGTILPTADATFYTPPVDGNYSSHQVYVEFFSDAAATTPVTPTAGTVTIAASPTGTHYLAATNPVVTANTVIVSGLATYTPPSISGDVYKLRAIFAGITGAAYARITLWSRT